MDAFEICALIFSILLCILTIPNVYLDIVLGYSYNYDYDYYYRYHYKYHFYNHIFYLDRAAIIDNLAVSIVIMVGACLRLSAGLYKTFMIILIVTDVISFLYMILFLISGYFNWVKFVNLLIITPLIIFIDKIRKKRGKMSMINPEIAAGSPIVAQNDPLLNNNQIGNVQTSDVSNSNYPSS